jgi:hypothetical protein
MTTVKRCEKCHQDTVTLARYCGAWVCNACGNHQGLYRCYCGWSASGGDGYRELIDEGETIEPDEWS